VLLRPAEGQAGLRTGGTDAGDPAALIPPEVTGRCHGGGPAAPVTTRVAGGEGVMKEVAITVALGVLAGELGVERRFRFYQVTRIPRPIAAMLAREGAGAVRHRLFEGGLRFVETIGEWRPARRWPSPSSPTWRRRWPATTCA
jgi:hypothetical protein